MSSDSEEKSVSPDQGKTGETVTSTGSYDDMYKEAVFELLKTNWDAKNDRCTNWAFVNKELDRLRAEAALRERAAEDKCEAPPPKKSKNYSRFCSKIASQAVNTILDEYEELQNKCESFGLHWGPAEHRIEVITGQVDVLQKVCAVVEYIEDQTSKGMASEKQ